MKSFILLETNASVSLGALLAPPALLLCALAAPGQSASIVPIAVPGSSSLSVRGLNQSGNVTGIYRTGGFAERAFFWSNNTALDIGSLGGTFIGGHALNNSDQVVGYSSTGGDSEFHAFVFERGGMLNLDILGSQYSSGTAINEAGQVTGEFLTPDGWEYHTFLFSGGVMHDLGTLGGSFSFPTAINNAGQVVGQSSVVRDLENHAFLFSNGAMRDLGTLGGKVSEAQAINSDGRVTGSSSIAGDGETHAFLHDGTSMRDLMTLGGTASEGVALNEPGDVIGNSSLSGDSEWHGFVYSGGVMRDLGTLGGTSSQARAINNRGQIVGVSSDASAVDRAFLWQNSGMVDLNSLLPPGSGWDLSAAYFINDASQIVGTGKFQGQTAWFLMSLQSVANRSPFADAGRDQVVETTGAVTETTLDGSASSDPDGDSLSFEWFSGNNLLGIGARMKVALGLGSHTFVLRVTDVHGAAAHDDINVTVVDTTPPTVQCPEGRMIAANENGIALIPDFVQNLVASDNAGTALIVTQSPATGTPVGCGAHVVAITVADATGNQTSCVTSLTVADFTPPVISCPNPVARSVGSESLVSVPDLLSNLATRDNCTPANELTRTQSPPPGGLVGPGGYEITITVADAAGNVAECVVPFTVSNCKAARIRSVRADHPILRDGSHEMVPVTFTVATTESCTRKPQCRIVSVKSSDPVTGRGDTTTPDWKITGDLTVELRAERSNPWWPRIYTIEIACTDSNGLTSTRHTFVFVRKSEKRGK